MHLIDLRPLVPVVNGILFGLLAMVLHEIGHMCVAQALGLKVKDVGISWKGMYTVREAGPPEKSLQVSLGGPLTNLALLTLWPVSPVFGLANLFMGLCNLLPIKGSDGERVMRCLEQMRAARKLPRQTRTMCRSTAMSVQDSGKNVSRRAGNARCGAARESQASEIGGNAVQRELSSAQAND